MNIIGEGEVVVALRRFHFSQKWMLWHANLDVITAANTQIIQWQLYTGHVLEVFILFLNKKTTTYDAEGLTH